MQRRNDEKDGKDGKDAEPVNVDSLVNSLREEIIGTVVDSVKSIQVENVIRSLTVDRIYAKPKIFGAFANQYHLLYGSVEHFKEYKNDAPVYNTFAEDDIVEPLSVIVRNDCDEQREDSCCAKRIVVKSWGAGFTDTATVTRVIEAKTSA